MPVQSVRKRTSAPPQNYWTTMEQEDEVHGFVCAVDQSLNDCIKLIQQGCPVDQVRDVLSRVPMAEKFAKYWICQVRLMEREGNFDVLPTFEEAVRIVRESVDELRSVVFEILKRKEAKGKEVVKRIPSRHGCSSSSIQIDEEGEKEEHYNSLCTPKPVAVWIHGEKGESSVIKYKITATPSGKIGQKKVKPGQIGGHEIRFFTPVRRSLRIERTAPHFPAALQEHDPCVTSLRELLTQGESEGDSTHLTEAGDSPLYVYRENEALKEQVHVRTQYSCNVDVPKNISTYECPLIECMLKHACFQLSYKFTDTLTETCRQHIQNRSSGLDWKSVVVSAPQSRYGEAVTVYSRMLDDNSVSFALCFERSNAKYFPVVQRAKDKSNKEEIQFQVRKISGEPSEIVFDDMYLFKWGGGNDAWGTLVSVAEPSKYLSVSGNRVVLSSKPHSCFRIIPQHDFPIL
ncbi:hypothetical protein P4O66_012236 [Electrophorus voltai]|uniref:Cytoskeleton-associated protein 2 C-terminal domain-containing protein n=1 Tax=Electrophorus voltai TaxID=2609070 RepID=A0AAD9DTK9_9TELE|nr:hypothetical protein P4O66_012236 [Electrophorus voltai]